MKNFPQSFEPVGSDSILEQFIQLKNYLNDILSSNEYLKTIEQNLTEEQKAQVRENIGAGSATINVIDNLVSTSIADPLSANQGRVLNEKITNDIESLRLSTVSLFSQLQNQVDDNIEDISELFQQSARALKTPIVSPTATELVGIDDNNSQVGLSIGGGLSLENGTIKNNAIKLLWQNPNPTSTRAFSPQTITLNSSDYDFLVVVFTDEYPGSNNYHSTIIPKGQKGYLELNNNRGYYNTNGDSIVWQRRTITYVSDTEYTIGECNLTRWLSQTSAINSVYNNGNKPMKIWGVKAL